MVFNINDFKAHVGNRGLAKNNLFYCAITVPTTLSNTVGSAITSNELTFFCKSAQIPSFDLTTVSFRQHGYGKEFKRPMDFSTSSLPLIFMVDAEFGVMRYFHKWMQSIFNFNTGAVAAEDVYRKLPNEFEYRDNYAARIELYVFSTNDVQKVYKYTFDKAYPVSIGTVDMSWENQAEVMALPVNFEYDSITLETIEYASIAPDLDRQNGLVSYISAINGIGQAINQIQRPQNIQDILLSFTNINTILGAL
jgi:hypothetical protein